VADTTWRPAGGRAAGGSQAGRTLADAAVKAKLNFNLKFNLRSAAVKLVVKPRTFEAFRGPTTGCTLTRRGPAGAEYYADQGCGRRGRRIRPRSRRTGRGRVEN